MPHSGSTSTTGRNPATRGPGSSPARPLRVPSLAGTRDNELVDAALRTPRLAGTPKELPYVRVRRRERARRERLRRRVEAHDRARGPLGDPDDVRVVNEHRVGHRARSRELPLLPPARGVVQPELADVPLGDPDPAPRIAPHAARALVRRRRLEHRRWAARAFDTYDGAPRKRGEVNGAVGHSGDVA